MNYEERRRKYEGNIKEISPLHLLQSTCISCMHSSTGGLHKTIPSPPQRGVGSGWEIKLSIGVALYNIM